MSHENAVRFNNEGVSFLVAGEDQRASQAFSGSLKMVKSLLAERVVPVCDAKSSAPTTTNKPPISFSNMVFHTTTPVWKETQTFQESYLFLNAFVLDTSSITSNEVDEDFCNILSACTIFNVAVLHHRRVLNGHRGHLKKAEQMYQFCIKIIQGIPPHVTNATSMLALLAAMNNLSLIALDNGAYNEAKEGFQYMFLLIQEAHEWIRPTVPVQEWNGLISNAMLVHHNANSAPAA